MKKYFVQQRDPDGVVTLSVNTDAQIIQMYGFRDCTDCEYEVYVADEFGKVVKLEHSYGKRPNYHYFSRTDTGEVEFEGESPEH